MTLVPEAQAFLEAGAGAPAPYDVPVAEARAGMEASAAAFAGEPEAVASVEALDANGVPCRLYRPEGGGRGALVYFHGGGWVLGSLETADGVCRALARRSGAAVLSVGYRLAPEDPYPAAADDAWAATEWAAERFEPLGVGGDSAGGNLAAVVALRARGRIPLALQLLVYPIVDAACDTPSYAECATGYGLTAETMRWFWEQYVPDEALRGEIDASPLRTADFAGAAPAWILTVDHDVLRDEAEAYARRLEQAGVATTLRRWPQQFHGFFRLTGVMEDAHRALDEAAAAVRGAFA